MRAMSSTASHGRRSPVAMYDTASASRARISSTSLVALTPTAPTPARSPASRPALAGLCTSKPTSSSCGCSTIPRRASCPTFPVAHWMTLYATVLSLRFEFPDGDAVVAGIGAPFEPAVVVDADDLADAEPVRSHRVVDHVEASVSQRLAEV